MLDFTTTMGIELCDAAEVDRKAMRAQRKWHRILRDLDRLDALEATTITMPAPKRPGGLAGVSGA